MPYTLDPAIAGFFATGGGSLKPQEKGIGSISIIDEYSLSRIFCSNSFILNYDGYQQRTWTNINIDSILPKCEVNLTNKHVGSLIETSFWNALKQRKLDLQKFCLNLSFTPGMGNGNRSNVEPKMVWH